MNEDHTIKIVSEQFQRQLSMAIAKGELGEVKRIVKQYDIDVDSYLNAESYEPLIMEALSSYGFKDEIGRLDMLEYFLENGADPNRYCKSGYNCLHIAAQSEKLVKALDLFLDFNGDVNLTDNNGATVGYWVIQSFPWRKEGAERQLYLDTIEKVLMLGADLDLENRYGMTTRKWLEHKPEDVKLLAIKCEGLNPVYIPSKTLQPEFPTNLQYPEIAKKIWNELVPPIGQANTVQGELLRAIEKLRDEAQRNANVNFWESHKLLAKFTRDTLVGSGIFDKSEIAQIKTGTKKLMNATMPYTDDDIYDYLTDQVCRFYLAHDKPIKHEQNPQILC